jgi:NADH-quinone oxidoreductase subunit A
MPELVGYLLLFVATGVGFILVHLLLGKLIRPAKPYDEKMTIYECGEPTIGSAWVQFDLRFYVVALLFVIFDVEVAFFFPWAVVFGKFADLAKPGLPPEQRAALMVGAEGVQPIVPAYPELEKTRDEFRTTLTADPASEAAKAAIQENRAAARQLAWIGFLDIFVFFGVLLVGFAYLWRRGDLNWVRSVAAEEGLPAEASEAVASSGESRTLVGTGQGS